MRTKIVASATAASILLMNVAAATGQQPAQSSEEAKAVPVVVADVAMSAKRPLLADVAMSAKRPLMADIAASAKRPLITAG